MLTLNEISAKTSADFQKCEELFKEVCNIVGVVDGANVLNLDGSVRLDFTRTNTPFELYPPGNALIPYIEEYRQKMNIFTIGVDGELVDTLWNTRK